jgi:hypothetical protein
VPIVPRCGYPVVGGNLFAAAEQDVALSLSGTPSRRPRAAAVGGLALAALAVVAAGAAGAGCTPFIHGNGVFVEDARGVPTFAAISIEDPMTAQVEVVASGAQHVVVSGDSNVVQQVEARVVTDPGGSGLSLLRVYVSGATGFDTVNPLRVDITVPDLQLARADDGARVVVHGAAATAFTAEATEDSTLQLSGPGGDALVVRATGSKAGSVVDASGWPVHTAAVTAAHATVMVEAAQDVTGSLVCAAPAEGFCRVKNYGVGACDVTGAGSCAP